MDDDDDDNDNFDEALGITSKATLTKGFSGERKLESIVRTDIRNGES